MGGFPRRDGCGGNWRNDCRIHNRYQLVKLLAPLAVVGKIGADIAQQQARG